MAYVEDLFKLFLELTDTIGSFVGCLGINLVNEARAIHGYKQMVKCTDLERIYQQKQHSNNRLESEARRRSEG